LFYGDGMKSIRQCIYRSEFDMKTLVWTRGPNFPLSRLESRLMCPECGSRRVSLLFNVPKLPVAASVKRATQTRERAKLRRNGNPVGTSAVPLGRRKRHRAGISGTSIRIGLLQRKQLT
jgi:hypothetical protein